MLDICFVAAVPQCVKSPISIVAHHASVMVSLIVPIASPTHGYCVGIFLMADCNTFFLLVRKQLLHMKKATLLQQGSRAAMLHGVFFVNEFFFYVTWVVIRLLMYPVWIFTVSVPEFSAAIAREGTWWNVCLIMPLLLANVLISALNVVWTSELLLGIYRRGKSRRSAPKAA